jgi:uncharacterized Zn-finger protein
LSGERYGCEICPKKFKTKNYLSKHYLRYHKLKRRGKKEN